MDATDNASTGSTLVIESFKCDWRHYEDINAAMDSINLPVYQAMVNEGLVISWGMYWHDWADEWNFHTYTDLPPGTVPLVMLVQSPFSAYLEARATTAS